jgi:hypothetical protein
MGGIGTCKKPRLRADSSQSALAKGASRAVTGRKSGSDSAGERSPQYTNAQPPLQSMPGAEQLSPNLNWRALALASAATCALTAASILLLLDRSHFRSSRRSSRRRSSKKQASFRSDEQDKMPQEGEPLPADCS